MENSQANEYISWASVDDGDALVPLMAALYRHDVPDADDPTLDEIKAHIALLTAPTTPHRLAVAWHGEDLAVGLAAVAMFVSVSDPRPERWYQAELKELFVLPDFRGNRIGAALFDWVEASAIAAGACRLDWHVRSDNHRGIAFYTMRGADTVSDRRSMRKQLTPATIPTPNDKPRAKN